MEMKNWDYKLFPLHGHSWSGSAFQLLGMLVDIEGTWNLSPKMTVYELALCVRAPKKNCFKSVNSFIVTALPEQLPLP